MNFREPCRTPTALRNFGLAILYPRLFSQIAARSYFLLNKDERMSDTKHETRRAEIRAAARIANERRYGKQARASSPERKATPAPVDERAQRRAELTAAAKRTSEERYGVRGA